MRVPCIVIAAARSGLGKTSVSVGIVGALARRGLAVQPFKVGPDYIDPSFLSAASGRPCRNIDTILVPPERAIERAENAASAADVAIVEGVMGLFDGASGTDECGSTAEVAKLLDAPVVVILDAAKSARSVGAVALGFKQFDPDLRVAGFIVNFVASDRHQALVTGAISAATGLPVLGVIRRDALPAIPSRHLGLVPAWEEGEKPFDALATAIESAVDLDRVLDIARKSGEPPPVAGAEPDGAVSRDGHTSRAVASPAPMERSQPRPIIAVARDDAFHFYYQDNLDILVELGVEVVPFSPIEDSCVPEGAGAIYFGGGYPELHAEDLAANESMLQSVRQAVDSGMPILAECGGLMYLVRELVDSDGQAHRMAGVISARVQMGRRLAALGYYQAEVLVAIPWASEVESLSGHVYHWSTLDGVEAPTVLRLSKPGRPTTLDGFLTRFCLASYLHVHFAGCPALVEGFVAAAGRFTLAHAAETTHQSPDHASTEHDP